MKEIHSALDEIENWLKAHASHLARALRPSLTHAQMQALISRRRRVAWVFRGAAPIT
jgi:hypothetical protein